MIGVHLDLSLRNNSSNSNSKIKKKLLRDLFKFMKEVLKSSLNSFKISSSFIRNYNLNQEINWVN